MGLALKDTPHYCYGDYLTWIDRILTVYRLTDGGYGKPELYELRGETQVGVLPDIVIQWDDLLARLPVDY
ncbi:MAG: hypothetical protein Q8N96_11385 [Methylovulum sp.]|nr:hypothetical protein [Methylovulum sp.]